MPNNDEPTVITVIAGRVISDPESRDITVGGEDATVVNFRVAVTRTYGDRNDPKDYGESKFYGVGVWREDLQDWVLENIHRGSNVAIEGNLTKTSRDGTEFRNLSAFRIGLVDWYVRPAQGRVSKARQAIEEDDDL